MKAFAKMLALILALLLAAGAAAAESALPEIPVFASELETRMIETEEDAVAYAQEFWSLDFMGADFTGGEWLAEEMEEDEEWFVTAIGDECVLELVFGRDGGIHYADDNRSGWDMAESVDPEEVPDTDEDIEWRTRLTELAEVPFLRMVNPSVYEDYCRDHPDYAEGDDQLTGFGDLLRNGENEFIVNYSDTYQDGSFRMRFVIQVSPVIRIVDFNAFCDPLEGGNG